MMPDQDNPIDPALDGGWQRLWFSLTRPWTSLAVVPTEQGNEAEAVAEGLVAVGQRSGTRSVRLVSAIGSRFEDVERVIESVNALTARGELVLVTVNPIASHPAALPIIRATSGALIVVRMSHSHLSSARNTVRAIGRDLIVGSVVLG